MNKFPHECPTCHQRRDTHDASFKDWEAARKPLEERIKKLEAQIRTLASDVHQLDEYLGDVLIKE